MSEPQPSSQRDATLVRRRRVLYLLTAALLAALAVYGALTLELGQDDEPTVRPPVATPVIVARIKLSSVAGQRGRGLGELINRNDKESLRVLASRLRPNREGEAYQLVLAGGPDGERMLGNAVVGDARVFVGEAELSFDQLERYKRVELRRVTAGERPTAELVLRGKIPR